MGKEGAAKSVRESERGVGGGKREGGREREGGRDRERKSRSWRVRCERGVSGIQQRRKLLAPNRDGNEQF